MEQHFEAIKQEYDQFYKGLLAQGRLPVKDTGKGFWGASVSDEVFKAFRKVRLERFGNFFDLGAGDGKVVLIASLFSPKASGMEIDEELVGHASRIKSKLSHIPHVKNAQIVHGNFDEHDLGAYDFLYCNPDRPFYRGLEEKLKKEMNDKAVLMVYGLEYQPYTMKKIISFDLNGTKIGTFMK